MERLEKLTGTPKSIYSLGALYEGDIKIPIELAYFVINKQQVLKGLFTESEIKWYNNVITKSLEDIGGTSDIGFLYYMVNYFSDSKVLSYYTKNEETPNIYHSLIGSNLVVGSHIVDLELDRHCVLHTKGIKVFNGFIFLGVPKVSKILILDTSTWNIGVKDIISKCVYVKKMDEMTSEQKLKLLLN